MHCPFSLHVHPLGPLSTAEAVSNHITSSMKTHSLISGADMETCLVALDRHFCFVTRLGDSSWHQLRNEIRVVTPEDQITSVRRNYFRGKKLWVDFVVLQD